MNIWMSSDYHFGHDNIIKYTNRPFKNSDEMDKHIIMMHNRYVQEEDIVYMLGDLGLKSSDYIYECIKQMKGKKIICLGNHDKWGHETYYKMGFSAVLENAIIRVGKQNILLSHYPNKNLLAILKTFLFYIRKMKEKNRSWTNIWQRLVMEWKRYRIARGTKYCCHGHVHSKKRVYKNNIDVGVDANNFRPVGLRGIIKIIGNNTVSR